MKNKLELYGTLGPADCSKAILKEMFRAGMTGIRLNLSHTNLRDCESWLQNLYEVSEELHIVPDLLVDLQGPELRIGMLKEPLLLEEGSFVRLTPAETDMATPSIPIPDLLFPHLKKGQTIRLDDGKILLEIADTGEMVASVVTGGTLTSRKSVAIDDLPLELPTLTTQDLHNLDELAKYRVTGVMLPFVRNKNDLLCLKEELLKRKLTRIRIFAKIENQTGLDQLPELIPHCDQIVIARGDLGNAVPLPELPGVQKKIALLCQRTKTPFMVVTQMLASMEEHPTPTRAEVSDIFNAVLDGASSLMLTGETAIGKYPVEAMQILSDTAFEGLRYKNLFNSGSYTKPAAASFFSSSSRLTFRSSQSASSEE